jgi:molecular chaperone Hsp33
MSSSHDCVQRFYFDNTDIRGEIVSLRESFRQATAHQVQHPVGQRLLGEFFAAVSLLAGILKFEGLLTLQVRGDGVVPLIMAESSHERQIRGIVRLQEGVDSQPLTGLSLAQLVGSGVLSITIDPTQGQRYQGIIALEGHSLADALSHYFAQSEQLPTRIWLHASEQQAAGLLLQALPPSGERKQNPALHQDAFDTAVQLANTVTGRELLELDHQSLLYRLFNEYDLRVMPADPTAFHCSCSKTRSGNALVSLGAEDAYALLTEQGEIQIDCQFCGQQYGFNQQDLDSLFQTGPRH